MPYKVVKEEDQFCVYRHDEAGDPMGKTHGCHGTMEEAQAQMRALYAAENKAAVKFADADENVIEGIGMPFGGLFDGQDLAGEHFSKTTDFCFDWYASERPLLYHHGLDKDAGTSVIGRVKAWKVTDVGVWVQAQLDSHNEYVDAVKELVRKKALAFSSGAMAHLVRKNTKTGELTVWPWVELSMTPTPCNIMATLDFATAKAHFKAIGVDLPDSLEAKATLDASARNQLDDSDFAYIDSNGGRHLPIHDEAHVRAAMARFNQTQFEDEAAKEKAHKKIMAAAHRMGMQVSEDSKAVTVVLDDGVSITQWVTANDFVGTKVTVDLISQLIDDGLDTTTLDTLPLANHAEAVKILATSLLERTKDLQERRVKEGRMISTGNRKRLGDCLDAMQKACTELQGLLGSTEVPAKAADVRLRLKLLSLYGTLLQEV